MTAPNKKFVACPEVLEIIGARLPTTTQGARTVKGLCSGQDEEEKEAKRVAKRKLDERRKARP